MAWSGDERKSNMPGATHSLYEHTNHSSVSPDKLRVELAVITRITHSPMDVH